MSLKEFCTGLACGLAMLGSTLPAQADDSYARIYNNESSACKNAGGVYRYGSCDLRSPSGNDQSSGGSSLIGSILFGLAVAAIYCGSDEDNCKSSQSK